MPAAASMRGSERTAFGVPSGPGIARTAVQYVPAVYRRGSGREQGGSCMPRIMLVDGWEEHGRHAVYATLWPMPRWDRFVRSAPWETVRVSGAGRGEWSCRVLELPEGAEVGFSIRGSCNWRAKRDEYEYDEVVYCVVDPRAPVVRIAGPSCCGRAPFVEGPVRITQAYRSSEMKGPSRFVCETPQAFRDAGGEHGRIPVLEGLWIDASYGFPLYARRCSIHGHEVLEDAAPIEWHSLLRTGEGLAAVLLTAARRYPDDRLPSVMHRMMRMAVSRPAREQHGLASAWLRETLGWGRQEIVGSLEAISELARRFPPAPFVALENRYWFGDRGVWDIAGCILLPALAAATDSCAECDVLLNAIWREGVRLVAKRETVWEKALEYIRVAAEVLRNPARYVL